MRDDNKMKIFTCKICGEVYIGEEIPHTCPFCGVKNKYFRLAHVWHNENNIDLTDISKKNIEKALEIELSNTAFYKCAHETLTNTEISLMFKGLMKVENEHASIFRKLLKRTKDQDPHIEETCVNDPVKCIEESSRREKMAVEFYAKAMKEAEEPRVKEVFEAIMMTEADHLTLDKEMSDKINNN